MKTSIIIATKDRPLEIERFLNSVLVQIDLPEEVIIVDSSKTSLGSVNQII